jgi:hypothetical protein
MRWPELLVRHAANYLELGTAIATSAGPWRPRASVGRNAGKAL